MKLVKECTSYRDAGVLLLRLVIAAIFLYHASQKWPLLSGPAPEGMPAGLVTIFKFLAIAEPLAAIALILGLFTRAANTGLILVMICAIYFKTSTGGDFGKWEIDLLLLTSNILLFILGPGKISIDAKIAQK